MALWTTIVTMISLSFLASQVLCKVDYNAYSKNINKCLFSRWPKGVLSTSFVSCKYSELCYSDNGKDPAQYAVCYNTKTLTPDFTGHIVQPNIGGTGRSSWHNEKGKYAPKPQSAVNDYKEIYQKGLYPNFKKTPDAYAARGHLTPNADFTKKDERSMTMINTNIAPQWQPFNAGNWFGVEAAVREYATSVKRQLYVFTGTSGVSKVKLNRKVTSPSYFWKIVCDPSAPPPKGAKKRGQSVLIFAQNTLGEISTAKVRKSWNVKIAQTKKKGVIELTSVKRGLFSLPKLGYSCNPSFRGTFLDPILSKKLH